MSFSTSSLLKGHFLIVKGDNPKATIIELSVFLIVLKLGQVATEYLLTYLDDEGGSRIS